VTLTLTLRPADPSDRLAVDALLSRVYPKMLARDYPAATLRAAHPLIAKSNPDLLASGTYHLIEENGEVICVGGWSRGYPTAIQEDSAGHVRHVATDPRHLRRGHAAHLMKHVLAEARATRLDRLECLSTTTAQSFYAGLGFMPVQNIDADIGGGVTFPVVKMQLPL
tara:strand:- start:1054 stop:1554 length:501 start_codon:yes stop_codon:yes gene_type:complete